MAKDIYIAILKRVKEDGMLNSHFIEKSHRAEVDELIEEGQLKHIKDREYELTRDGEIELGGYKRHRPIKYEKLKLEDF